MNRCGRSDVLFLRSGATVGVQPRLGSGREVGGFRVLRADSPAVPNAIAAILLALRDVSGVRPHAHFEWSEGSPIKHLLRYLILGRGDTPPVVREIIRRSEPDPSRRPGIHVGG